MAIKLKKEEKDQLIENLQRYFFEERDEELGTIGSENLIRFFLDECAPLIYNHAIDDVKREWFMHAESIEEAFDVLKK